MSDDLSGRSVVITGAAGGIGAAMVDAFAAKGARLALVDINDPSDMAARLGPQHGGWACDLAQPAEIARVVAQIGDRMGIDVLINNAGVGIIFPAEVTRIDDWDRTQAVNLRAPWLMAAAALPYLKASGRGRVVNIASQAGMIAIAEHVAYGASKAGLIGLTKVLALEWAQYGITVNAISPTVVETPMALVGWAGEKGERAKAAIPVGRFAQPSEIAHAAVYLASASAGIVTGANLVMDGGFTIQ